MSLIPDALKILGTQYNRLESLPYLVQNAPDRESVQRHIKNTAMELETAGDSMGPDGGMDPRADAVAKAGSTLQNAADSLKQTLGGIEQVDFAQIVAVADRINTTYGNAILESAGAILADHDLEATPDVPSMLEACEPETMTRSRRATLARV